MGVAMLDDGPNWFSGWCWCGHSEFNSASERKQNTKEIKLAGSSIYKKKIAIAITGSYLVEIKV